MNLVSPLQRDKLPAGIRTLAVIEALLDAGIPLTPTAINDRLNLPKATIHRICHQLLDAGWLARDTDGKRVLPGRRLAAFAGRLGAFSRYLQARVAILRRLSESVGETCNITIPDREGMVYLDRVETRWPLRIQLPVGVTVPFHGSASGKLYLSTLRRVQQRRLVRSLRLEPLAVNTITDPDELLTALEPIRRSQVGTDNEELVQGMVAVAVPINDDKGRLVATLAVHGPTYRMSLEDARQHVPMLRDAAAELRSVLLEGRLDGSDSGAV